MDHPEKKHTDSSDDMSADELAAYQKIMGEIEGRDAAMGDEPDSEPTDDFSAELEKVAQEADTAVKSDPAEAQSDDSEDGLDEDQQQALESIMAEIEGGKGADKISDSGKKTDAEPALETKHNLSGETAKVVEEADAVDSGAPAESQTDESGDGLNEDQQQALEHIMDQIEGGGKADADIDSEAETEDQPDPEAEDDFSAKLTKVLQEADTAEDNDPKDTEPKTVDDMLDEDRQKELEIDDILKSITEDDETPLPDSADDESVAERPAVETLEENILVDDIVISKKEDNVPEDLDSSPEGNPNAKNLISSVPEAQELAEAELPGDQTADLTPAPASPSTPPKAKALRETSKSTGGRKKRTLLASATLMVMLALVGYVYWSQGDIVKKKGPAPVMDTNLTDGAVAPQSIPPSPQPVTATQPASDQSRLKTAADNLDQLRNDLIEKQVEIEELRTYYQTGIDAQIQSIADTLRQAGKAKLSFKAAMADPQIRLGLSAIQRRDTYVKKLQAPLNTLFHDSEELLYFSRKAKLLSLMAETTSDIDIDNFIAQIDEVRRMHGMDLAQLNIDAVETSPLPLESIWQDVVKGLPARPIKSKNKLTAAKSDNAVIWKQICDGDYTRIHKLTALSAEAARCLAAWKGKDLFLNGLTELPANTARQLAVWEGDWLGLNGLAELSPEAAMHLSRWKGKKLSLNGLSRLSPRVVAILSEWQGEQIEMVNVKHMAHWENTNTRLFLSEDLSRKRKATRN